MKERSFFSAAEGGQLRQIVFGYNYGTTSVIATSLTIELRNGFRNNG